jgi:hypothetical protein
VSAIWAASEGPKHLGARYLQAWRVIEGQHKIPTRKLVDTLEEHELLEQILDQNKPPPPHPSFAHLHYLLYTPFRYPPLRHGSRFGTRGEASLWYGSFDVDTALAERAYYRLLFLDGTAAALEPLVVDETAFAAAVETEAFIDLTAAPFARFEEHVSAPDSYAQSQPLGAAMRADQVAAFLFVSARAKPRGLNVALFEPVFAARTPTAYEGWKCTATRAAAEFRSLSGRLLRFGRAQFEVSGRLPSPGA